jgi:hypothetical protein
LRIGILLDSDAASSGGKCSFGEILVGLWVKSPAAPVQAAYGI